MLYVVINGQRARAATASTASGNADDRPLEKEGGFQLVFSTRYLLLIALMILVTNVVNTTGEYILGAAADRHSRQEQPVQLVLGDEAAQRVEASSAGENVLTEAEKDQLKEARIPVIQSFYGRFFSLVNLLGLIIQMFFVSRIFKHFGVRAALFVLPFIALGGYAAIGVVGGLLVLRVAKTLENATDYSLQNTVKQALFLPTSREAKYKAKAAIDTFFVRFGDAASAGIVALGLNVLAFEAREFALVNVALCGVWILLSVGIAREHRKMVADSTGEPGGR
jgi:AAA family ATP:ADP antiporter